MKKKITNANGSLKTFFVGIAIACFPFLLTLIEVGITSGNNITTISETLKTYTSIISFFTTPLSVIIAIIAGGMAYRKYFEDKGKEQEGREKAVETQITISNRERANRLYDLLNSYAAGYDGLQVTKSTGSISGGALQEIRDNVVRILETVHEIDPNPELESIYLERFGIRKESLKIQDKSKSEIA